MDMLWYPGQDVDFMRRLEVAERTNQELQRENDTLNVQVTSLEEMMIFLTQSIDRLERMAGVEPSAMSPGSSATERFIVSNDIGLA